MEQRLVKHRHSRAQHRRDGHLSHRRSPLDGTETAESRSYTNPRREGQNSGVALASDEGNNADLVENWLSKVSRRDLALTEPVGGYHPIQGYLNDSTWRPQGLPFENAPRRSHKRTRSQDSSIINPSKVPSLLPPTTRRHEKTNSTKLNDSIDLPGTPSPEFEKRPRHKTREGRYDTQERVRQRRKKGRKERRPPPNNLPRKISSSGREVMDKFRSGVILNDRLTLQPCRTPGLFQNGRVSSPRPVEELAFNSMASLEHPPPHQSSWQQKKRSQSKQSQRRERELEEMATFIGRKETPTGQHKERGQRRYHENSENWQSGIKLLDDYSIRPVPQLSPTRSIVSEACLEGGETRQPPQIKSGRSTHPLRSSSRATSYITWSTSSNHQRTISDDNSDRSSSRTPETVREALWRSGVFGGTGLRGKNPNFEASFHQADDLCNHNKTFQGCEEHVTLEKPTTIVRYTDKGVMTNNELHQPAVGSKAPENSESPKPLEAMAKAELPTQPEINNTHSKNVQTYCSAEVDCETNTLPKRADAATQASFGLQSTEDVPNPAPSKFFQRTPAETPAVNEPAYLSTDKIDMQPTTAVRPRIEATLNPKLAKGAAVQPQNREVRNSESAMFDVSWTPSSASESRHIDHLLAQDSMLFYRPTFLENRPPTRGSNSHETSNEKDAISKPWTYPQTTVQESQQKGLPRALTVQSHGSAPMPNVSQLQSSESMADFIARIEQDALRDEKYHMAYRQRAGDFSMTVGQHVGGSAQARRDSGFDQLLGEPDWVYYQRDDDANANGPKLGSFLETELFAQPRDYQRHSPQRSIDQTEAYEREEMNAFWRPNYFCYR
ncbi:uncharacterized protein LY79DRAFT_321030 [Colletotrichum navitas]|uniref:Uncharacterized protein n=1 Tax=Colletotrichum navitas TaxID=681940 RepID=A0AAD8Q8U2_9PEZI|nr:uncharacterized protein LY79DRAFT_321030 [Colletotrichum navitas]KAK1597895.1 hypothetical protein LY79DRAFT_321030 [Colletotrichum navitas]